MRSSTLTKGQCFKKRGTSLPIKLLAIFYLLFCIVHHLTSPTSAAFHDTETMTGNFSAADTFAETENQEGDNHQKENDQNNNDQNNNDQNNNDQNNNTDQQTEAISSDQGEDKTSASPEGEQHHSTSPEDDEDMLSSKVEDSEEDHVLEETTNSELSNHDSKMEHEEAEEEAGDGE